MQTEISLDVSYHYSRSERKIIPHVSVVVYHPSNAVAVYSGDTQQAMISEHDGIQHAARFFQRGEREDITIISGAQKFRVQQVQGEPFLHVPEYTLPVKLRLNGLPFSEIAQERDYMYLA